MVFLIYLSCFVLFCLFYTVLLCVVLQCFDLLDFPLCCVVLFRRVLPWLGLFRFFLFLFFCSLPCFPLLTLSYLVSPSWFVLHFFVLSCLVLPYFVWFCLVLPCLVLFHLHDLSCITLLCLVLSHYFVWFCLVLRCLPWFVLVWLTSPCLTLFCIVLFCFVLPCFALFCFVLRYSVLISLVLLWVVLHCFDMSSLVLCSFNPFRL